MGDTFYNTGITITAWFWFGNKRTAAGKEICSLPDIARQGLQPSSRKALYQCRAAGNQTYPMRIFFLPNQSPYFLMITSKQ